MMNAPSISMALRFVSTLSSPSIRDELQSVRNHFFSLLIVCTVLVAVGVILEDADRWFPSGKPTVDRDTGVVIANPSVKWQKMLVHLGWLLIIVGVVGEGFFETDIFWADETLETFDNTLLAITTDQAGSAAKSATTAHVEADAAVSSSSNALNLATGARKEADSFEKDIVSVKKHAADAESLLAAALKEAAAAQAELVRINTPRSLTNEDALIAALSSFKGTEYTIYAFEDDETIQFTRQVGEVLGKIEWVRKQPVNHSIGVTYLNVFSSDFKDAVPVCIETGVQVSVQTKESIAEIGSTPPQNLPKVVQAAIALRDALPSSVLPPHERNVSKSLVVDTEPNEGPVSICVGKKP